MKPITVYEADDGTRFNDPDTARARDLLCAEVRGVMSALGPSRDLGQGEHYQHPIVVVVACRLAILRMAERLLPTLDMASLTRRIEADPTVTGVGTMGSRFIDELDGPVPRAWRRLCCIAPDGKEYNQQYYATHQDEADEHWRRYGAEAGQ